MSKVIQVGTVISVLDELNAAIDEAVCSAYTHVQKIAHTHEMSAVEYGNLRKSYCTEVMHGKCAQCDLFNIEAGCSDDEAISQEAVDFIEHWSQHRDDNKITYADDFFSKFPRASMTNSEIPYPCRNVTYGLYDGHCHKLGTLDCAACWNEPYQIEK